MEDFAIDLDKVLDDFEISEGSSNNAKQPNSSGIQGSLGGHPPLGAVPSKPQQPYIPYDPPDELDLSEANFAPSPPMAAPLGKAGGYFIPETGNIQAVGAMDEGVQEYKENGLASSNGLFMDSRPELLRNTALGDYDAEQIVPVSQGLPSHSQPDVVPVRLTHTTDVRQASCHCEEGGLPMEVNNQPEISLDPHKTNTEPQGLSQEAPVADLEQQEPSRGSQVVDLEPPGPSRESEVADTEPLGSSQELAVNDPEPLENSQEYEEADPKPKELSQEPPVIDPAPLRVNQEPPVTDPEPQRLSQEPAVSDSTSQGSFQEPVVADPEPERPSQEPPSGDLEPQESMLGPHMADSESQELSPKPHGALPEPAVINPKLEGAGSQDQANTSPGHKLREFLQGKHGPHIHAARSASEEATPDEVVVPAASSPKEPDQTVPVDSVSDGAGQEVAVVAENAADHSSVSRTEASLAVPFASDCNKPPESNRVDAGAGQPAAQSVPCVEAEVLLDADLDALVDDLPPMDSMEAVALASELTSKSDTEEASTPVVPTPERRSSGGSLERFLNPSLTSPSIATPMEESGLSKVPGYQPDPSAMADIVEEDEQVAPPPQAEESSVRPKDLGGGSKRRPNSLLGLSTPVFSAMAVPAPAPSPQGVNPHDALNVQLAQQRALGSGSNEPQDQPLPTALQSTRQIRPPNTLIGLSIPNQDTTQPEAPPLQAPLAQPQASPIQPQAPPSQPEALPHQFAAPPHPSEAPPHQQRRPCSLNLPPPAEFKPAQQRSPSFTPDALDMGGAATGEDGSVASSESSVGVQPAVSAEEASRSSLEVSNISVSDIPPPPMSANVNMPITHLGKFAPIWLPDAEAPTCMQCEAKFTFTKRRHHCRACGKVFCSTCCNLKSPLGYLNNKEARVCSRCFQDLVRAQVYERMHSDAGGATAASGTVSPNPNNPNEYCSTIPPLQQAQAGLPPPTVMVPSSGVLRKQGSMRRSEPKQVMFSDGIRPGGDLTELDGSSDVPVRLPPQRAGRKVKVVERSSGEDNSKTRTIKSPEATRHTCLIPESGLPPVILQTGVKGDFSIEENPDPEKVMDQIRSDDSTPVVFAINKNLFVIVKMVSLDCCVNRVCWNFTTKGMCTVNQAEIVYVLECLPDEKEVPRDIFTHLNSVYEEASRGNPVSNLGHVIFTQPFLDSRDHGGFLYMAPTFQCQQKLILPTPPYIFGVLLQKWEIPWAKVFPLRLMLRLGAEFRYYPCPLISVRFRKPVYGEIGHTIMNLLADFRNYQYMLPSIRGVTVHMEDKWTYINFPRNRYDQVMKVVGSSNDHVMALGANFSPDADSHLVCIQNDEGTYQTQAINIQNKPRKVTGASFVVFNGALKQSSGLRAKSSIVEDGLMVQITAESLAALKAALKDMQDYDIGCGPLEASEPDERVRVQWVEEDRRVNVGVLSPVDGMSLEGVDSILIHNATDYAGEKRAIRWTECFFVKNEDHGNRRFEPVDQSRLAEALAQACCMALTRHLDSLKEAGLTRIGLRATVDADHVGYEAGSNGEKLPDYCMNDLDTELIPVIHNAASHTVDGPVTLELTFHVVE